MVFDTRVSSEQTVKQQEHTLQGVAQMVMNMETEYALPPATSVSQDVLGECFVFASNLQQIARMFGSNMTALCSSQTANR